MSTRHGVLITLPESLIADIGEDDTGEELPPMRAYRFTYTDDGDTT